MPRDPYPLQWPEGWPRSEWPPHQRRAPKFTSAFAQNRDSVLRQLKRRGSQIAITSDLPTRADGLPYANATCADTGIAVWWIENGAERVIACDRWPRIQENLRAIDMSLEALRGLDRWGTSEVVERAFAGFAALPAGAPAVRTWREVLGIGGDWVAAAPAEVVLAFAKAQYRKLIQEAHPDRGGLPAEAAAIIDAFAQAERELGPVTST